ncbi:Transducin/WD40 repeat-like superfamily protein [Senna tora]|uniref:Transducin/WD40 repeat-like superfamily protein n=1 Tax=Senna tora TaxID=362788 RepID=A0A834SSJ5_9FABA|nr:Transducin/WD40 repeat-like superfamily protein [Senna tora]
MMKGQCIPRFRSSNNSCTKNKTPSPMTLLERFREAVLRLMMLSALSKATTQGGGSGGDGRQRRFYPSDSHNSEAVADCIEFIKKKAAVDGNRYSSAVADCNA